MNCKGKHVALATAAVAVLLSIVAIFAAKNWIREQWWLYELRYGDENEIRNAAIQLSEFGSMNAMAALIWAMDCEGHHLGHGDRFAVTVQGDRVVGESEECEARYIVGEALEKLYARFYPNHNLARSDVIHQLVGFPNGMYSQIEVTKLLQKITDTVALGEETRNAATTVLNKCCVPMYEGGPPRIGTKVLRKYGTVNFEPQTIPFDNAEE